MTPLSVLGNDFPGAKAALLYWGKMKNQGKYNAWRKKDNLLLLTGWARDGLSETQIAHNVGVSRNTLVTWKNKFPEIGEALRAGREVIDYEVENALVKRALGYTYTERTYERIWNERVQKYIKVNTKSVTKEVAPDVGAICFWLKNRRPKNWKDRPDLQMDSETLAKVDAILASITAMTKKE